MSEEGVPPKGEKVFEAHFVKSPHYRTVHVDGLYGGATPSGQFIAMSTYCERWNLPDSEVIAGETKTPVYNDGSRTDFVREFDTTLIFNLQMAKEMKKWLEDHITRLEAIERIKKTGSGNTR